MTMLRAPSMLLLCLAAACDPRQVRGLTTGPEPVAGPGDARERAYALVASVAARHGFRPVSGPAFGGEDGWRCHDQRGTLLCAAVIAGAVQVYFAESSFSLTSGARATLDDVEDALRAAYGPGAVHPCTWRRLPDPEAPQGGRAAMRQVCVPLPDASGE